MLENKTVEWELPGDCIYKTWYDGQQKKGTGTLLTVIKGGWFSGSTALIEMDDGTLERIPLHCVKKVVKDG